LKKGILLVAILSLFMVETGFSQTSLPTNYYSQTRFGVRAAATYSNVTNIHLESKPRVGGLQFGAYALFPISQNDKFYFQPELNYSNQGEYDNSPRYDGKQKAFMNYLNVPLNFKFYLSEVENSIFIEAGPYIGFRIGKNKDDGGGITEIDGDTFKSFDLGGIGGIGYSFQRKYEVSLRYSLGLLSQVKNAEIHNTSTKRTSVFNLGFTYIFE